MDEKKYKKNLSNAINELVAITGKEDFDSFKLIDRIIIATFEILIAKITELEEELEKLKIG